MSLPCSGSPHRASAVHALVVHLGLERVPDGARGPPVACSLAIYGIGRVHPSISNDSPAKASAGCRGLPNAAQHTPVNAGVSRLGERDAANSLAMVGRSSSSACAAKTTYFSASWLSRQSGPQALPVMAFSSSPLGQALDVLLGHLGHLQLDLLSERVEEPAGGAAQGGTRRAPRPRWCDPQRDRRG